MRHYLERLRQRGELLVTDRPVSARHELAAITEKVQRTSNRPILFTNVSGTELPVLTNTYGSRERLAGILGIGPRDFCRKWNELANLATLDGPPKRSVAIAQRSLRRPVERSAPPHLLRARRWTLFHLRPLPRRGARDRGPEPLLPSLHVRERRRASLPPRPYPPPHHVPREGRAHGPSSGGGDADRAAARGLPRRRRAGAVRDRRARWSRRTSPARQSRCGPASTST